MSLFSTTITGVSSTPPAALKITQGDWGKNVPNSSGELNECPCFYMDRFTNHGKRIREAFENAVVNALGKFMVHRDAVIFLPPIHVVVMGSGGLLQDAMWLQKLFSKRVSDIPPRLVLHLVNDTYKEGASLFDTFKRYVASIVPSGVELTIRAWNSYEVLKTALKVDNTKPHLVIGIDTDDGTEAAKIYQKNALAGDLEKVLFIKHEPKEAGNIDFYIYHRKGSGAALTEQKFNLQQIDSAAQYVEAAAWI